MLLSLGVAEPALELSGLSVQTVHAAKLNLPRCAEEGVWLNHLSAFAHSIVRIDGDI